MSIQALLTSPMPFADGMFNGKTVLISGAGSGIGRAAAYRYARLGANLVLCGRDLSRLQETAAGLASVGREVLCVPMTIRDPEQVSSLFAQAEAKFGGIHILVNNAGGQFAQPAIDFSVKGWNAVIDTNLNGTWYMMQTAARRWKDSGTPGTIVNVVAVVWRGMPGIAHSCAARAGVIYLSKTVAVEWAPLQVRVNCVAPGVIEGDGLGSYPNLDRNDALRANPLRTLGQQNEVADACCYLSSASARFMTGEVVTIDGGQQLHGELWPAGRPQYFSDTLEA